MNETKTIGQEIAALVKQYGNSRSGIYILERALQEALGAQTFDLVNVGGKLTQEWPRYKEIAAEESAILAKYATPTPTDDLRGTFEFAEPEEAKPARQPSRHDTIVQIRTVFLPALRTMMADYYAQNYGGTLPAPTIQVEHGAKYAKVIREDGSRSVYCFIALEDIATKQITAKRGDVLKAATWHGPAKHARGNIFGANPIQGCGPHGTTYMADMKKSGK